MARIVAVHGIGQHRKDELILHREWLPGLVAGLRRARATFPRATFPDPGELKCAFYGDIFLQGKAVGDPLYNARDVTGEWEEGMLRLWWEEAIRTGEIQGPDEPGKVFAPNWVQQALSGLSRSQYWTMGQRLFIGDLKQASAYMNDDEIRRQARERVAICVEPDTKIIIAHSLGSVVAYETLCEHPEWQIPLFITLGSPLGIANFFFHRLQPSPQNERGVWPGNVQRWTNVADPLDPVALVKNLQPLFGERVHDVLRRLPGLDAHASFEYLAAEETGCAIAAELASE
jgi:hypothetical protein